MGKKAFITCALAGFINGFLKNDIKTLQELGYEVYCGANANAIKNENVVSIIEETGAHFKQIDFDSKNMFCKKNLVAYRQLKRILKENKFDLVHCHTPIAGALTRVAARKYRRKGCKVIYTTHGFTFTKYSPKKTFKKFYFIEKFISKYTDVIITINKEDYKYAETMECKNVEYISGVGIDFNRFNSCDIDKNIKREEIGVSKNEKIILSVGELSSRKNHKIIIEALNKINDKNLVYVICGRAVGENSTENELLELSNRYGVKTILLGFRRDIPEIMSVSDIGAIPSLREGLGLVGPQSLACGVPLVGSDVQGIRDYIIDGKTGYLCHPEDVDSYAKNIIRLLEIKDSLKENCIEMAKKIDKSISNEMMRKIYTRYCK